MSAERLLENLRKKIEEKVNQLSHSKRWRGPHLVVPDHSDVCGGAAGQCMMGDVVMLGPGDPTAGEEEWEELRAQRLPPHVLNRKLAAGRTGSKVKLTKYLITVIYHEGSINFTLYSF